MQCTHAITCMTLKNKLKTFLLKKNYVRFALNSRKLHYLQKLQKSIFQWASFRCDNVITKRFVNFLISMWKQL